MVGFGVCDVSTARGPVNWPRRRSGKRVRARNLRHPRVRVSNAIDFSSEISTTAKSSTAISRCRAAHISATLRGGYNLERPVAGHKATSGIVEGRLMRSQSKWRLQFVTSKAFRGPTNLLRQTNYLPPYRNARTRREHRAKNWVKLMNRESLVPYPTEGREVLGPGGAQMMDLILDGFDTPVRDGGSKLPFVGDALHSKNAPADDCPS